MDISIIINTYNQYKYLERCISSCITQSFKGDFEIIVVDSSENKNSFEKIYQKFNSIKLINKKHESNYPCINQMQSIKDALKLSKGKIIFLLDGDDFFDRSKIEIIYNKFKTKQFVNQDLPILFNEKKNKRSLQNIKYFKLNSIYKFLVNSWLNVFGTSCLSCDRQTLESFYIENNNNNFPFLAIDTLLVHYASLKKKYYQFGTKLTIKSINNQNLDKNYSGFNNKNFWIRRMQQHKYFREREKYYNLDYLITLLINKFKF